MTIYESQLANLRRFGYTEVEARFLYLVATHSGYFTVPHFLTFARAKSGKRNAQLVEKLFRLDHARGQRYTRRSVLYHLGSRGIYDAIGKAHLRNRRDHKLAHIKIRLLALDYILAHPDDIDPSTNWTQSGNTPLSLNGPLVKASPRPPQAAQVAATGEKCDTDDTARPVHLFCEYLASGRLRNVIRHGVRFERGAL
ncbi:MAG: hypothetical protein WA192_03245 [Candidatus Acidiferrales bacterium]